MLEILQFIFRNFWTWIGTLLLLAVLTRFRFFSLNVQQKINSPSDDHHTENNNND